MGNFDCSWARAAQSGTLALAALLVGCASSTDAAQPSEAAAARDRGDGASGDSGPADDAGLPACAGIFAGPVGACVLAIEPPANTIAHFTGTVRAIESSDRVCTGGAIGNLLDGSPGQSDGPAFVVSDGETTVRIEVYPSLGEIFASVGRHGDDRA